MTRASDTRRELIEKTALRLFAEKGYADVSVRDIAQACGIGESALYRHMTSKEDLAVRVFREAFIGFGQEMHDSVPDDASLHEKLSGYLAVMLEGFDRDPVLMRFLLINQHDTLDRAITDTDITPVTIVHGAIISAAAKNEINAPDPALTTALVMGAAIQPMTFMIHGRVSAPAMSHHPVILERLTRLLGLS